MLNPPCSKKKHVKFIYGNYKQYYGYRNKHTYDNRLEILKTHRHFFLNKEVLDIGCNNGFITMAVAKEIKVKSITGIDIDKHLIAQAGKNLSKQKQLLPFGNEAALNRKYPFNVFFFYGNYVVKDDVLLEIEVEIFDTILALSITKWIHLNFGDIGLKQTFRRMFLQLRSGGVLILEPQPFKNYYRRKNTTDVTYSNYKAIKFFPDQFVDYLLSSECGFESMELIAVPEHCQVGFKRPIYIFKKK